MDNQKIGKFIQTKREELGLSQKKLGEYLVVSEEVVASWENGAVCPDEDSLRSLANLFFCDVPEILSGGLREKADAAQDTYSCDVTVNFDFGATNTVSPLLFGDNLEHTRGSVNGGLSAQMLQNRKFAGKPTRFGYAHGWYPIGETACFMFGEAYKGESYTKHADGYKMNRILECNAQVMTSYDGKIAGIGQKEISVRAGKEYAAAVVAKAFSATTLKMKLVSADGKIYDEADFVVSTEAYERKEFVFAVDADDDDARLEITFEQKGSVWIGAVSLMPKDNFRGMRVDVIEKMKELGTKLLRWPGGNFAGEYSWKDGLLDRDQRAPLQSYQWLETQPHTWGYDFHEINVDDFVALCREIGAEPFITINPTWDTPEESAQWVEYCNGDETTPYGKLRMERGYKEPYNVKFWSLGNEFGYGHMEGANTPQAYAKLVSEHAKAMLKVTPGLNLCSSGPYPHDRWAKDSAKQLKGLASYVSLHHYASYPPFVDPAKRKEEYYSLVNDVQECFLPRMKALREQLDDDDIKISYDEWNAWYAWYRGGSVSEAIMAASFLNMIIQNADAYGVGMVCHFESVNEGALQVLADRTIMAPTGRAFSIMQKHAGGKLCAAQDDVTATVKGNILTCTLINRSYDEEKKFSLEKVGEICCRKLYSSEDVVPRTVFEESELQLETNENCVTAILPPHSIALLQIVLPD